MTATKSLNSKANIKQNTEADIPFSPRATILSTYKGESTAGQTVINLGYSVNQANTDVFFLFIDGKKLSLGVANDFVFTNIDQSNRSSQVTVNSPMISGLQIEAYILAAKKEVESTDSRILEIYDYCKNSFQGFASESPFLTATNGTPGAGQFRSAIAGRASIPDLANNLKAHFGVERIPIKTIVPVQDELGPNNERVFSVLNDEKGLIRFYGLWTTENLQYGQRQYCASGSNSYIEIVFFGTGLNLLAIADGEAGRTVTCSIDGGAESSDIWTGNYTSILSMRNYSENQVLPVVSGLAFGLHTARITFNGNNSVQGLEVLNEATTIKTNPGNAYISGKKRILSLMDSSPYNSGFTNIYGSVGTRGGHVLKYMDSMGNIKKDIRYCESAAQTLANTDHSNEEVIRAYSWREFGAGRADDFSSFLPGTTSTRAFTLEDGSTTLSAYNVGATDNSIIMNINASYIQFSFMGTGLDITQLDNGNGGSDSYIFTIDNGSSIAFPTAGSTIMRPTKICSGLPYGMHVVRFYRVTAATWGFGIVNFTVYGPKKPALPDNCLEIADYYLMADFLANNGVGLGSISQGVLWKAGSREMIYGNTCSFNGLDVINANSGFNITANVATSYVEYTFFGTGFEFRGFGIGGQTRNETWSVDGSSNLSAYTTAINMASMTFVAATGLVSGSTGAGFVGGFVRVTGLPLGKHTVRVTQNTPSAGLYFDMLGIIVPVHSPKSNLAGGIQNTLPIGSCSLCDSRKIQAVENKSDQRAWAQANGVVAGPTTTLSVLAPMPDMNITIKTNGRPIRITAQAVVFSDGANSTYGKLFINGAGVGPYVYHVGTNQGLLIFNLVVPVAKGVHSIQLYWTKTGGTSTAYDQQRVITAEEI